MVSSIFCSVIRCQWAKQYNMSKTSTLHLCPKPQDIKYIGFVFYIIFIWSISIQYRTNSHLDSQKFLQKKTSKVGLHKTI